MSKNKKRQVSGSSVVAQQAASTTSRSSLKTMEFNPDYTPIITDLKKIGLMAAGFTVILVVISFFIG